MALWEKEEVQNKLSQRKKNGAKACPAQIQNEILLMHGSSRKNKKIYNLDGAMPIYLRVTYGREVNALT